MKTISVFGTRPEAIKMCPLIMELNKCPEIDNKVCLTGQHKELLEQAMSVFSISADWNFEIMRPQQSLEDITSRVLKSFADLLSENKPDLVLVHGDTTTAYAASLAAFYAGLPVGHVEAGLRTYDLSRPFPEEFNRRSIDLISELCFAPTDINKENLLREGKKPESIFVTGNTVVDAVRMVVRENFMTPDLVWAKGSRLILLTVHRRENWGDTLTGIFNAVLRIVNDFPEVKVLFPVHFNPKVRDVAKKLLNGHDRIRLIEPLDVDCFYNYMAHADIIFTDSGGIQEEAPALGKPVLVLREKTERPEGIDSGTVKLVGTRGETIYNACRLLLTDSEEYRNMSMAHNPYGDGYASKKITECILEWGRNNRC